MVPHSSIAFGARRQEEQSIFVFVLFFLTFPLMENIVFFSIQIYFVMLYFILLRG